jgi:chaperonin cofactor prefoldin
MSKDDATFYLLLGEFAVGQANSHSDALKMFLKRFETLERVLKTTTSVLQMPDGDEKQQALAGLHAALEHLPNPDTLGNEIRTLFARHETQRERLEAFLQNLSEWKDRP